MIREDFKGAVYIIQVVMRGVQVDVRFGTIHGTAMLRKYVHAQMQRKTSFLSVLILHDAEKVCTSAYATHDQPSRSHRGNEKVCTSASATQGRFPALILHHADPLRRLV